MASMQMAAGLSEQDAGLFDGLFGASVNGDGESDLFAEMLDETLAAFQQALAEGEVEQGDWLNSLQQKFGEDELDGLLTQLGLKLEDGHLTAQVPDEATLHSDKENQRAEATLDVPDQNPIPSAGDESLDTPDNLLNFLTWAESALNRRVADQEQSKAGKGVSGDTSTEPLVDGEVLDAANVDNDIESISAGVELESALSVDGNKSSEELQRANVAVSEQGKDQANRPNEQTVAASVQQPQTQTVSGRGAELRPDLVAAPQPSTSDTPVDAEVESAIELIRRAANNQATSPSAWSGKSGQPMANGIAGTATASDLKAEADAKQQGLFDALAGDAEGGEPEPEAEVSVSRLANAVAQQLGSRNGEGPVPQANLTSAFERAELASQGVISQSQTATGTATQTPQVQQARADLQTMLQQAVDIRQQEVAANQLRERMMLMVNGRMDRAEIRLDPPELGSMMVRVQVQQDQAQVQIVTQNQQAKEMLEQSLPRLREMLQQQGVALGDTQVSHRESQGEQGQAHEHDPALAFEHAQEDMLEAEIDIPVIQRQIAPGRVDYFA
ncbi:flagellar hook-length control protein FliK [Corallincola platygyrae]|uniref:Flagellar hook-length control protein FliK n=1 Tax=Corallincola platygyrae TaxID=1193278 RepID=A0ABW4XH79_9GAMM